MQTVTRPRGTATYQDIIDAPENLTAEVIYGTLRTHRTPPPRYALARTILSARLVTGFDSGIGERGGWTLRSRIEVKFGDDFLVPTFSGWKGDVLKNPPDTNWVELVPDWVCEIHTAETRKFNMIDKTEIYAAAGVRHLWFLDTEDRTLICHENRDGLWTVIATLKDDDLVCVAPFDAVTLSLGELWPETVSAPAE